MLVEIKEEEGNSKRGSSRQLGHYHKTTMADFKRITKKNINNCRINLCNYSKAS